jgi:hypothetical protein
MIRTLSQEELAISGCQLVAQGSNAEMELKEK